MGDRHRDPDALTSLHGRRSECAALDALLDRLRAGRSAVLVLRGEAGIGKTALLGYLKERAAGSSVARCMGIESEMELAFSGLHDLCAPMLSNLDALDDPGARRSVWPWVWRPGSARNRFWWRWRR